MIIRKKSAMAAVLFYIFLNGCSSDKPVLEIEGRFWPENTSVISLREGTPVASSLLFGDRIRLMAPGRGLYRVRAAHPEFLTSLSPEIPVESGVYARELPVPVARRRIGTIRLGISYTVTGFDSVCIALIAEAPESFSTISFSPDTSADPEAMVRAAHEWAVETVFHSDSREFKSIKALKKASYRLIDDAVRYGADGVEIVPGARLQCNKQIFETVREIAARVHREGMTLTVGIIDGAMDDCSLVQFFESIPAPECPDELALLCDGTASPHGEISPVSTDQIENALLKIKEATIPLSRVSVEVRFGAVAWDEKRGGKEKETPLEAGVLEGIVAETGEGSLLRLGSGTLQLVYRDMHYSFEDLAGISTKMEFLRTGDFARVRGVRIRYDGTGLKPDAEGMRRLAEVFGK